MTAEMASEDVMAEIVRLRGMVRALASERDDLTGALKRHMQSFTNKGTGYCGGCLEPAPCPDAGLLAGGGEPAAEEPRP